jgi:putative ABC transport system permease protein
MASKLPLGETVAMALTTLKANRLRSLLTMLGIVIGNASVITLVGIGKGAQNLAEGQLNTLGANVLFVVPGNNDTRRQGIEFPENPGARGRQGDQPTGAERAPGRSPDQPQ